MSRELERMRKQSMAKVEATQNIIQKRDTVVNHINQVGNEYKRVTDVSRNAPAIVENIDRQFKEKTKLTDWDIKFLFLCTAMQCARQYLLTNQKITYRTSVGNMIQKSVSCWSEDSKCLYQT